MKILRLELFGFKSFKDKTIVTFDQAITGIVGSNGCGKSNVVDALYWVMGDMSPKHLRGSVMTDVIFSGSRDEAPMDLAEVTMVLERNPGVDPELPPQFQASTEIQITRRYYRNGESEYLINKVACRLRDIQEFFMDTGVGAKAYSIVEQGAISRMINLKPEDRRVVIEEVAGIMKFKARRAETERKIEYSKLNLQRVDDIVTDLQKQLISLKRQADKAERFKAFSEELKTLELRLAAREWVERSSSKNTSLQMIADLRTQLNEIETTNLKQRETFELAQTELTQIEIDLGSRRDTTRIVELQLKDLESEATNLKTKQESLHHRIDNNKTSITEMTSRSGEISFALETVVTAIEQLNNRASALAENLDLSEQEFATLQEKSEEIRSNLQVERKQLHQEELSQTRLTQQIQNFQRILANLESKKSNITSQLERIASDMEMRESERQSTLSSLELAFATRTELETKKLHLDDDLALFEHNRSEKLEVRDMFKEELQTVRIRKEQLESLERDLDGVDFSAKTLALHLREGGQVEALLADSVKVPKLLEKATEAVLGKNLQRILASDIAGVQTLQNFVLNSTDSKMKGARSSFWLKEIAQTQPLLSPVNLDEIFVAINAPSTEDDSSTYPSNIGTEIMDGTIISDFGSQSGATSDTPAIYDLSGDDMAPAYYMGRENESTPSYNPLTEVPGPDNMVATTTFVPVQAPEAVSKHKILTARDYLNNHPDVVGPLDMLVSSELAAETPWLGLLQGYWVVRSRDTLFELAKDFDQLPLNFVSLDGDVLTQNGNLDLAPLEHAQDEESVGLISRKRVITDLKTKETVLTAELDGAQKDLDECLFALAQTKEKFRELTSQLAALNPDVEKHSVFLRQVESQIARLSEKRDLITQDLEQAIQESHETTLKLEEVTHQFTEAETRKALVGDKISIVEEELSGSQAQLASLSSRLSELRTETKTLDRDIADNQSKRAAFEQEQSLLKTREIQLQDEISRFETSILELNVQIDENSIRVATQHSELNQSKDLEAELSETVSKAKSALKTLAQEVERLSQETVNLGGQVRDLEQGIAIHEVEMRNLAEKVQNLYQIDLASLEEATFAELTTATDLEELADPETGKKHAHQLRQRIDNLGKINMVAIEEFEELRRRHEYLFIQREDLNDAIVQLQNAIERIDRESKERFGEAFHAVNGAFQKTFPLLFGGGHAELRMTNPENLLETGVEIIAQPPGKKLQSVTLLSGGEKAMTAVSLIFGIFSIKPSPFCVLDEVDAPLDDANVGRFCNLVRTITQVSQVIMITHHKKTMEHSDALFGVTMEKPGVSKLVSIKLGELHHEDFIK